MDDDSSPKAEKTPEASPGIPLSRLQCGCLGNISAGFPGQAVTHGQAAGHPEEIHNLLELSARPGSTWHTRERSEQRACE